MTVTLSPRTVRTAVAVSILVLGIIAGMAVSAATAGAVNDTAYTALTPCASFDSRTDTGILAGKFSELESRTYQITGVAPAIQQGGISCGVPAGADAVLINIVAIQPENVGNLRAFATGDSGTGGVVNYAPAATGLNNSNAVTIPLSTSGQLDVQANCGGCPSTTVHARGVILGYFTDDLADRVAALEATQPFAVHADGNQLLAVTATDVVVRSVTLTAPVAGIVTVNSTVMAYAPVAGDGVWCSITTGTSTLGAYEVIWQSAGNGGDRSQVAATRGFAISAGAEVTYNLACKRAGINDVNVRDSAMTAIFTPNP